MIWDNLSSGAVLGRDGNVAGNVPFGHESDKLALVVLDNQAAHVMREHLRRGLFDAVAMADTGDLGMTISDSDILGPYGMYIGHPGPWTGLVRNRTVPTIGGSIGPLY